MNIKHEDLEHKDYNNHCNKQTNSKVSLSSCAGKNVHQLHNSGH